ncbi:MAG: hydroxyisourate hydrolase [Blastomonas fulva]|nr:hydroxyisourate hydrolase [Blastomonas fulva]
MVVSPYGYSTYRGN